MKNCQFCNAELDDHAAFCSQCGNKQADITVTTAAVTPPPAPYPYPPQAAAPKEPSALALEGRRYFKWLTGGIFGNEEPMHLLFAAIVPFVITLFYTLASARMMNWHAGGFFLLWFFSIVQIVALPAVAWLLKRHMLKQEVKIVDVFSTYASFHTIILPVALLVLLFGLTVSMTSAGGIRFISALRLLIPLLSFAASLLLSVHDSEAPLSKKWQLILALTGVFIVLHVLDSAILTAGMNWGLYKGLSGLFR